MFDSHNPDTVFIIFTTDNTIFMAAGSGMKQKKPDDLVIIQVKETCVTPRTKRVFIVSIHETVLRIRSLDT